MLPLMLAIAGFSVEGTLVHMEYMIIVPSNQDLDSFLDNELGRAKREVTVDGTGTGTGTGIEQTFR